MELPRPVQFKKAVEPVRFILIDAVVKTVADPDQFPDCHVPVESHIAGDITCKCFYPAAFPYDIHAAY